MASSGNIYTALSARAYAQQLWPAIGFHDHAAKSLAKLLGVSEPIKKDLPWGRGCLLRSQWFDERCCQFFQRYPQAMCIDLGAGLSTRFHRLSDAADWPRFSWVDVDLPDVIAIKARAIPKIDNYQLLPANIVKDDWLARSGWHPRTPLIITLESVLLDMEFTDVCSIFSTIARHCSAASPVEILFAYPATASHWPRLLQFNSRLQQLSGFLARLGLSLGYCSGNQTDLKSASDQFFVCGFTAKKEDRWFG